MACLDPQYIDKIKSLDLGKMTTEQRIKAFEDIMGGQGEYTAKEINLLFEKSKLLQNQKIALNNFFKKLEGISPEKKIELEKNLAKRIADKEKTIMNDELYDVFHENLNKQYDITARDIMDKKYNLDISDDKIKEMFNIRKEIDKLEKPAKGTPDGSSEKLAWGEKIVELSDLVNEEKEVAKNLWQEIVMGGKRIQGKYNDKEWGAMVGQTIRELYNFTFSPVLKSVKASLDNSILFRQGLKVLSADSGIWWKQQSKTWKMWGSVLSKSEMEKMSKAFKADLVTRDLYQDAIKAKLAIGVVEDYFPNTIVEKIPRLGNLFKASDEAFTMFSQGSRMDLFEKYIEIFKKDNPGKMPDADEMKLFAKIANSVTGRGGLGKLEAFGSDLNKILFSARYQTANINTFRHALTMTGTAGKIAGQQAGRHLLMVGGLLTTMSMFMDVGLDPKESTFGKVRVPGTKKWVDVTGSLASYFTVIGKTIEKVGNPEYKDTALDVIVDFMKGKLAPAPGVLRDILEQRDYQGKKPTVGSVARSLFVPISLDNPIRDYQKDTDGLVNAFSTFLEFLGTSVGEPRSKKEGSYKSILDIVTGK